MYLFVYKNIFSKEKNSTFVNLIGFLGIHYQGKKVRTNGSKGRE